MTIKPFQIRTAFRDLERTCESSTDLSRWLYEAVEQASKDERAHRAMGRRMVGNIGRLMSVRDAAMGIVLSHVAEKPKRPASWSEAMSYRRDVALAYAIRDQLTKEQRFPWKLKNRPAALDFDYAADVAGHKRSAA